jgi:hypothetical protein
MGWGISMNKHRSFSLLIRLGAASIFLAGMASHARPARSASWQASTVFPKVPSLVGYWPLDSAGGGVVSDRSGTSPANNGTLMGSAAIDTSNKAAVPSGNPASLSMSAATADSVVEVPDSASLSVTGSLTVAAWIRPTVARVVSPATGPQHGIIEKWDSGSGMVNGYFLRLSKENFVSFAIASPTGSVDINTSPRYIDPSGAWTHVAGVYDATTGSMKIYHSDDDLVAGPTGYAADGGAADPTQQSGVAAPGNGSSVLHIGDGLGAQQFGGNIDEARVYSKPLTQSEIAILVSMNQPPAQAPAASQVANQVVVSWGAASNASSVPVVYSVLRGTSSGVYDTAFNNINGLSYPDTPPASGTYYYTVVAVSVIPSVYSTERTVAFTSAPPPPPPPPAAPRTSKVGQENDPCGCGSAASPTSLAGPLLGLLAAVLLAVLPRRLR